MHPVIGLGFRTPTRPDTHQEDGTPFYKRLQVDDVVYDPVHRTYGKVIRWSGTSTVVLKTDGNLCTPKEELWFFGDFVIQLDEFRGRRRLYAQVSPWTRSEFVPFIPNTAWPVHTNHLAGAR